MAVIRFVVLVLAMLLAYSEPVANCNIIDDMADGITQSACVISSKSEFDQCYRVATLAYHNIDKVSQNYIKDTCCSYLAYQNCVEAVAWKRCGGEATEVANLFLALLNHVSGISLMCHNYKTAFDCIDTIALVAVVIIIAIVAIAIFSFLIYICQKVC